MCGLVGYITKDGKAPAVSVRQLKKTLLRCSARGTDATGIFWEEDNDFKIFKAPLPAEHFVQYVPWDRIQKSSLCIMHTRAMTQGPVDVFTNNHPLIDGRWVLAHNGVILNSDDFVQDTVVDSLAIFEALKLADPASGAGDLSFGTLEEALMLLMGTVAFSLFDIKSRKLFLLSSGNPLVLGQKENTIFWASTTKIIRGMRPYMISSMLTDYLVCIDKEYMKGQVVEIPSKITSKNTVGQAHASLSGYYGSQFDSIDNPEGDMIEGSQGWYTYNTTKQKYEYVEKGDKGRKPKKQVGRKAASGKRIRNSTEIDGEVTSF